MKTLFLTWQDPKSREWFPVGCLTFQDDLYHFVYTQGALDAKAKANFQPLWAFPTFDHPYTSPNLFPPFANRLLRSSRPEFPDFVKWLNIPEHQDDPIALLARSGGKRKTDSFEVFPQPERDENGQYHIHFLVHGLRYFNEAAQAHADALKPGEKLFIMHDVQNHFDTRALILRTENHYAVGYCPRYLTQDFFELLTKFPQQVHVTVERVNPSPTPLQFRLLCNLS